MNASYSLCAHDYQLHDKNMRCLSNSTQIQTSKQHVYLESTLDLAYTLGKIFLWMCCYHCMQKRSRMTYKFLSFCPINFSASWIINRNATAAAGKVMYLYADVTSKVDNAMEQVVLNNCATCPQQQIHQWQISAERIMLRIPFSRAEKPDCLLSQQPEPHCPFLWLYNVGFPK